jgi:pectate lyase
MIRSRCLHARHAAVAVVTVAAAMLGVALTSQSAGAAPELVAFPGAEGFGAGATGGRGGDVMIVDTLEPFGPGSLGEAMSPEDCRPRTVVFAVSGVIEVPGPNYDIELRCGNVTIAGQTAPGAGITIHGRVDGYGAGGNIIIRHIRFRPPPISDEEGAVDDLGHKYDSLQMSGNPSTILDHLSLSWGSDETLDMYELSPDSTVQWTTIEQSNPEGVEPSHNDGLIAGPDSPRFSVHHVLFAHHEARCPALASGPIELINSVMYDCQDAMVHHNPASGEFHIAGNTFIKGPSAEEFTPMYFDDEEPGGSTLWLYQNQITFPGVFEGIVDDISTTPLAEAAFSAGTDASQVISEPSDFSAEAATYQPITMQTPGDAYESVLASAGAFPRDEMTTQTVEDVRTGGGDWTPDPPTDLIAGLSPGQAPADADADGMADAWEADNGLDPSNSDDHATVMASGYTAIEEYVNGLSDQLIGAAPVTAAPAAGGDEAPAQPQAASPTLPSTDAPDDVSGAVPDSSGTQTGITPLSQDQGDGNSNTLAVIALVTAAVALVVAGFALHAATRRPSRPAARPAVPDAVPGSGSLPPPQSR